MGVNVKYIEKYINYIKKIKRITSKIKVINVIRIYYVELNTLKKKYFLKKIIQICVFIFLYYRS